MQVRNDNKINANFVALRNCFKGITRHFGKYIFSPSCRELYEKIDTTLIVAQRPEAREIASLALFKVKQICLPVLKQILFNMLYLVCFIHTQTEL